MSDAILKRVRGIYWHRKAPQTWPHPSVYAEPLPNEHDEQRAREWADSIKHDQTDFDDVRAQVDREAADGDVW